MVGISFACCLLSDYFGEHDRRNGVGEHCLQQIIRFNELQARRLRRIPGIVEQDIQTIISNNVAHFLDDIFVGLIIQNICEKALGD